jgi:hypothetical protein
MSVWSYVALGALGGAVIVVGVGYWVLSAIGPGR